MIETATTLVCLLVCGTVPNSHGGLPGTKCEHRHQTFLLACGNPQTPNHRQGEQKDDDILADVQAGVGEPNNILVHTVSAVVAPGPEEGDWGTHEDIAKDAPSTACYDYAQHDIASLLEATYRKDAEELNNSRHLGDCESEVIDPETRPECLEEGELAML